VPDTFSFPDPEASLRSFFLSFFVRSSLPLSFHAFFFLFLRHLPEFAWVSDESSLKGDYDGFACSPSFFPYSLIAVSTLLTRYIYVVLFQQSGRARLKTRAL